jgi:hypothetical protein
MGYDQCKDREWAWVRVRRARDGTAGVAKDVDGAERGLEEAEAEMAEMALAPAPALRRQKRSEAPSPAREWLSEETLVPYRAVQQGTLNH